MVWARTAAQVYADGPSSNPLEPAKSEIRRLLAQYENAIDQLTLMLGAAAGAVKSSKAALDAVAGNHANDDIGVVFADTDALNGIYVLTAGAWVKSRDLPGFAADAAVTAANAAADLADAARLDAQTAKTQSQVYAGQAQGSAGLAGSASALAITAAANAIAAIDVANLGKGYDTFALANAAVGALPDQQIVTVFVDETHDGGRSLYRKEGGALVFKASIYQGRQKLAAEKIYYVRLDGNDANTGLVDASGGAFATVQRAWDVASQLDTNRQQIKIKMRGSGHTQGLVASSSLVGNGLIIIEGDTDDPENVVISTTNADCFAFDYGARASITGVTMEVAGSNQFACIRASNGAVVGQGKNVFGACSGMHIDMGVGAIVYCEDDYTISGSASGHWHAGAKQSVILAGAITVTLTGTPHFSTYFAGCRHASIEFTGATFVGNATGQRYYVHGTGIIDGGGAAEDALPGDIDGVRYTGGQYLGNPGFATVDERDKQIRGGDIVHDGFANILSLDTEFASPLTVRQVKGAQTAGPYFVIDRDGHESGGPYNDSELGVVVFGGRNSNDETVFYGQINVIASSVVKGNESSTMRLATYYNGSSSTRLNIQQGLWMQGANGNDMGPGTINAIGVYDDSSLLTCMALAKEFLKSGTVYIPKWDEFAPPLVIPARVERKPVLREVTVNKRVLTETDDGMVATTVTQKVMAPVIDVHPVWDEQGNGVDALFVPRVEEEHIPEETIPRVHGTARLFKAMLEAGFDPRDPQQYFDKLLADEALPGMPTQAEWVHNQLSSGELFSRKWLATEMLAIVCNAMWIKLQDHETRLVKLEKEEA